MALTEFFLNQKRINAYEHSKDGAIISTADESNSVGWKFCLIFNLSRGFSLLWWNVQICYKLAFTNNMYNMRTYCDGCAEFGRLFLEVFFVTVELDVPAEELVSLALFRWNKEKNSQHTELLEISHKWREPKVSINFWELKKCMNHSDNIFQSTVYYVVTTFYFTLFNSAGKGVTNFLTIVGHVEIQNFIIFADRNILPNM